MRRALGLGLVLLAAGCASHPPHATLDPVDGPPAGLPQDVANLPEPVPRAEPRSRYGNGPSYTVNGQTYHVLASRSGHVERGVASWYGTKFHGRLTSSREPYDMHQFTAAHRTLPLPTYARVTNLQNGQSIIVRINDRGPFKDNRIIDLSYAAAARIGMLAAGTALVEVRVLEPGAETAPAVAANTGGARLFVQAGAFVNQANAERLRAQISGQVPERVSVQPGSSAQGTVYRVRIGPLASVDEADRLTRSLGGLGVQPQIVVD